MAKRFLVTNFDLFLHRHFSERYAEEIFTEVINFNPREKVDLRSFRGRNLVFVNVLTDSETFTKIVNGLGETGSLVVYTNVPVRTFVDPELISHSFVSRNNSIIHIGKDMKFTIHESHIFSAVEILANEEGISLNQEMLGFCSLFMNRPNLLSYDLNYSDFHRYCGGRISKKELLDIGLNVHPDMLDIQSMFRNSPFIFQTEFKFDGKKKLVTKFCGNGMDLKEFEVPHYLSYYKKNNVIYQKHTYYEH